MWENGSPRPLPERHHVSRIRTLSDLRDADLRGRRFLVRVDYNVPLSGSGGVTDSVRVDATLPSLRRLRDAGARTILVSHLGRPDGDRDASASLKSVAALLSERLGVHVPLLDAAPGSPELLAAVDGIEDGGVVLLENIRFHTGETSNDPEFAAALAELADDFIGDAFGVAHRAHASNVGAAEAIRARGGGAVAGLLMAREIHFLREVLREPERPFVAIMGGAKISGKIDLIRAILPKVDRLLIGGAMANTFLRALGLETGESLVEEDRVDLARELLEEAGEKLLLPVDCVVAERIEAGVATRNIDRTALRPGDRIGDIGPETRELFAREVAGAGTVLWNGPMGVFELLPFARGTFHLAGVLADLADSGGTVVVGGGDSAAAAQAAGYATRMTHISTGGGASLDLLAGEDLPGITVLETAPEPGDRAEAEVAVG